MNRHSLFFFFCHGISESGNQKIDGIFLSKQETMTTRKRTTVRHYRFPRVGKSPHPLSVHFRNIHGNNHLDLERRNSFFSLDLILRSRCFHPSNPGGKNSTISSIKLGYRRWWTEERRIRSDADGIVDIIFVLFFLFLFCSLVCAQQLWPEAVIYWFIWFVASWLHFHILEDKYTVWPCSQQY